MAMMNELSHDPVTAKSEETQQKADALAPLEEKTGGLAASAPHTGDGREFDANAFDLNNDDVMVAKSLLEEDEDLRRLLRPEPVVAVIFFIVVFFIGFITVLIYISPKE